MKLHQRKVAASYGGLDSLLFAKLPNTFWVHQEALFRRVWVPSGDGLGMEDIISPSGPHFGLAVQSSGASSSNEYPMPGQRAAKLANLIKRAAGARDCASDLQRSS